MLEQSMIGILSQVRWMKSLICMYIYKNLSSNCRFLRELIVKQLTLVSVLELKVDSVILRLIRVSNRWNFYKIR